MKVKAKKTFISAQYGNIDKGVIFDVHEKHFRTMIDADLVEQIGVTKPVEVKITQPVTQEEKPSAVFHQPTEEKTPGSSSQAGQVSQKKTVKKSANGGKKKAKGK